MSPEEIRSKLEFYRDLGIKDIYRRMPIATKIEIPSLAPDGDTLLKIIERASARRKPK